MFCTFICIEMLEKKQTSSKTDTSNKDSILLRLVGLQDLQLVVRVCSTHDVNETKNNVIHFRLAFLEHMRFVLQSLTHHTHTYTCHVR